MCICIELLATHKGPRAGVMVPWVKSLLRQHEGLSFIPRTHVCLFVKVRYCDICNPTPGKVETDDRRQEELWDSLVNASSW